MEQMGTVGQRQRALGPLVGALGFKAIRFPRIPFKDKSVAFVNVFFPCPTMSSILNTLLFSCLCGG